MQKKKLKQHTKDTMTLEKLADLMVHGFNDMQEQFGNVHTEIDSMQGKMHTMQGLIMSLQEQVTSMDTDIKSIKMELRTINERLDALEESVRDVRGYAKEIDDLRARVRKMELFLKQQGLSMA